MAKEDIKIICNEDTMAIKKANLYLGVLDNRVAEYRDALDFRKENGEGLLQWILDMNLRGDPSLENKVNEEAKYQATLQIRPCANTIQKYMFKDEYEYLHTQVARMFKDVLTDYLDDQKQAYMAAVNRYHSDEISS